MDWGTVIAAFVGAAIPSSGTLLTLRADRRRQAQDRRWLDADVVADVRQFLHEIEPDYRVSHIAKEDGAEAKVWEGFEARRTSLQRELLRLSTGHPNRRVRDSAEQLASALVTATNSTKFAVSDEIRVRDNPEWMATTRREHAKAKDCLLELDAAVQGVEPMPKVLTRRLRISTIIVALASRPLGELFALRDRVQFAWGARAMRRWRRRVPPRFRRGDPHQ